MKPVWIAEVAPTPLGPIWVAVSEQGLVGVEFVGSRAEIVQRLERRGFTPAGDDPTRTGEAVTQVAEYLHGRRQAFDLPVDWSGLTPFQHEVLQATLAIPFGQVSTYVEIAKQLGKPGAARAVGRAEATNPMPLVIPCHRVLGTDGKLHGYGGRGGLQTKAWLLQLEGRV